MKEIVILSASRTPIGSFMGGLSTVPAPKLGAVAIKNALEKSGVAAAQVDECLMGCVLPAGMGQAPARQAAIYAGLPTSVKCTTINRVCGSGLKAVMWASQMIQCGDAEVVVAGGMENMSLSPHLMLNMRNGYRLGNGECVDSMVRDGLWDVYNNFHMGKAAELCAKEKNISRAEQDRYAAVSYTRALNAIAAGTFRDEIGSVDVIQKNATQKFNSDEEPGRSDLGRFSQLKPAFDSQGTVTAANASTLADGAAALVVCSAEFAEREKQKPLAKIIAQASHAHAPEWFTTAPASAIQKLLKKAGLGVEDIDLFEINEAFAVVALAAIRELKLDESKVNVNGGAISLGHPLGASGARILTTLVHQLKRSNKRYGVAALCIGGGEASAILVERM